MRKMTMFQNRAIYEQIMNNIPETLSSHINESYGKDPFKEAYKHDFYLSSENLFFMDFSQLITGDDKKVELHFVLIDMSIQDSIKTSVSANTVGELCDKITAIREILLKSDKNIAVKLGSSFTELYKIWNSNNKKHHPIKIDDDMIEEFNDSVDNIDDCAEFISDEIEPKRLK